MNISRINIVEVSVSSIDMAIDNKEVRFYGMVDINAEYDSPSGKTINIDISMSNDEFQETSMTALRHRAARTIEETYEDIK